MIYGGTLTTTSDLHFSDDYISNLRMHLLSFSTSGWWTNYPVLVAKSHALYPMTPALVHYWLLKGDAWVGVTKPGIKLGMVSSNERRRHNVTLSLIGWAQTKNNPCQANVLVSVIFWFQKNWDPIWNMLFISSWQIETLHSFRTPIQHQSSLIEILTHWGRVTHICVSKLTIIGSDNGLSPGRHEAIIWTNAGIWLIGNLGTNFSEI